MHIKIAKTCHHKMIFFQRSEAVTDGSSSSENKGTEKIVHFHDDLRAGDFTYIKDLDGMQDSHETSLINDRYIKVLVVYRTFQLLRDTRYSRGRCSSLWVPRTASRR